MTFPERLRLVLFEPDIPQNLGALLRLGACLGLPVEVIEPCGFLLDDRRLTRAAMDYRHRAELVRHPTLSAFLDALRRPREWDAAAPRLVLVDTAGAEALPVFRFAPGDRLLFGRESCGVTDAVRAAADTSLRIPMQPGLRSFNLATAAAMVAATALTQLGTWPSLGRQTDAPAQEEQPHGG